MRWTEKEHWLSLASATILNILIASVLTTGQSDCRGKVGHTLGKIADRPASGHGSLLR
jgi:hypothetical protein